MLLVRIFYVHFHSYVQMEKERSFVRGEVSVLVETRLSYSDRKEQKAFLMVRAASCGQEFVKLPTSSFPFSFKSTMSNFTQRSHPHCCLYCSLHVKGTCADSFLQHVHIKEGKQKERSIQLQVITQQRFVLDT